MRLGRLMLNFNLKICYFVVAALFIDPIGLLVVYKCYNKNPWNQDYDGNWYNEYDEAEPEDVGTNGFAPAVPDTALDTAVRDADGSVISSMQGTPPGKGARQPSSGPSFDRAESVAPITQSHLKERSRQNPKDRWQWAFTRIVQVSLVMVWSHFILGYRNKTMGDNLIFFQLT